MARRDQPRYINSGYYLLPQNSLAAIPSDYAFDRDHAPRQPRNQKSEYHLASLNMFDHGTRENYHYVTADELRGLPASGENVVHGNVISLRALRERIDRMDSGFYRPILANGVLYLVPSEDNPRTARSSDSQDSVKTAIQLEAEATAREPESTRTARFPQSPLAKPAQPEIRLTLHQLKKLLGKELFKDVIRKYKLQHNSRQGADSREQSRIRQPSATHTAVESTAQAASSSTAVEPNVVSTRTARQASSQSHSTHSVAAYPPLSPLVGSESNGSLHSAVSFGAYDRSAHTAREPSCQSMRTARDSLSAPTAGKALPSFSNEGSSKDVDTAVEPDYVSRTAQCQSPLLSEYTAIDNSWSDGLMSSKDVDTAVEFSNTLRAAAFGSDSNTSAGTDGLHAELDDMVATAQQYLAPDTRRSMTEQGIGAALAGAPVFDPRAVRSANYLGENPGGHLYAATLDADVHTAREAASFTNLAEPASRATSTTSSTMAI